jgi:hypothetical protein
VPIRLVTNKVQTILYNANKAQKQKEKKIEQQAKKLSLSKLKDSAAIFDNQNQN